jgi:hypothetical protein
MRKFLILLPFIILGFVGVTASAHESDIDHVHSADIAVVESNLVLQGTVVSADGRVKNSVIVNDRICWEGETYTFNPETGSIVTRAVDDIRNNLPSLTLVEVRNGTAFFDYKDEKLEVPVRIREILTRRSE